MAELTEMERRFIASEVMKEELDAAVQHLAEIARESGVSLDESDGLDVVDKEIWNSLKTTRAGLAIKFVNAWHLVYDAFEPEDC